MKSSIVLVLFLITLSIPTSYALSKKAPDAVLQEINSIEQTCLSEKCVHLNEFENGNCVMDCISHYCWNLVYSRDPLEDGEIDELRLKTFKDCVMNERIKRYEERKEIPVE
ncbi:hypothetical protein WA158_007870 [Blastocystis sp. Blastoise]